MFFNMTKTQNPLHYCELCEIERAAFVDELNAVESLNVSTLRGLFRKCEYCVNTDIHNGNIENKVCMIQLDSVNPDSDFGFVTYLWLDLNKSTLPTHPLML